MTSPTSDLRHDSTGEAEYDISSTFNDRTCEEQSVQIDLADYVDHQPALRQLALAVPGGVFSARFVPEFDAADKLTAIAIRAEGIGVIGSLSQSDTAKYKAAAQLIEDHALKATTVGHWSEATGSAGSPIVVWLDVGLPTVLARQLREKFGPAPSKKPQPTPTRATGGGWLLGIVGESYRQEVLKQLSAGRRERGEEVVFRAELHLEPDNEADPSAVAVRIVGGETIGYLPSDIAFEFNDVIGSQPQAVTCDAFLVGGTADKPNFGVVLEFEAVKALKRSKRDAKARANTPIT